MSLVAFFDLEVSPNNDRILDIGCVKSDETVFHQHSIFAFLSFVKEADYLCGHNIIKHDLNYIRKHSSSKDFGLNKAIDTLLLSPLLLPKRPSHRLIKDDKLQKEESNNPLSDAKIARELFYEEIQAFHGLNDQFKAILYGLLQDQEGFGSFFHYLNYSPSPDQETPEEKIRQLFKGVICAHAGIGSLIQQPVELAYTLALIHCGGERSIFPGWVLLNYPGVQAIRSSLQNMPCAKDCSYCQTAFDATAALKRYFGYASFRSYGNKPLQEDAVKAAIQNKSLLTIFPTGGGKSITFQLPALMSGDKYGALTVVISPLQSLMKDQVDNLEKKDIIDAVAISGLLDPVDRTKAVQRVENGEASILYIAPESLRSLTIERILLKRQIARFVIDEAHCFSAWGQDFRVDYLYIGDFIRLLQEKKRLREKIPISCFTATARQKVIEDIQLYFKAKLNVHLELFRASTTRTNLHFKVLETENESQKYIQLRGLLQARTGPAVVYTSRTKKAAELALKLTEDGFPALAFHGKMEKEAKTQNQNAFMEGKTNIIVATSAFGMGVDKDNIEMVIHYNISDSLENYLQEAGRAGRKESIEADCYILFNQDDLDSHFEMHTQTKLTVKEINQIWKAIKDLTQSRNFASYSALEIARKAGWDDNTTDIETRVTTSIAALEEARYVQRGRNYPYVFANSILSKNAQEAIDKINKSEKFVGDTQKSNAARIVRKLFSSKSKRLSTDEIAESRVDYLADQLELSRVEIIRLITLLKDEKILADEKDITVFIKKGESSKGSATIAAEFMALERELFRMLEEEGNYNLKELNARIEALKSSEIPDCSPKKIRTIINFWAIKKLIFRRYYEHSSNHLRLTYQVDRAIFLEKMRRRHYLGQFIIAYLFKKANMESPTAPSGDSLLIEFSVLELLQAADKEQGLFAGTFSIDDVEDALFYLSRIDAIKIDGGFMILYNKLSIDRLEKNNRIQYKSGDHEKLEQHYTQKVQQIHIVGEYARKMIRNYADALTFVENYFHLPYSRFLDKYFPGHRKEEIKRPLTPEKFKRLFGELSSNQQDIIDDSEHRIIVVAAGPGSGKTKILVHKLASLLLTEDVKHEQLLMLTFSRAAATEFKERLLELIGRSAHRVEIKTFHSYCFDLLGKIGNIDQSENIITEAIKKIQNNEIETSRITKTVLVIDEAQDMDVSQYQLVQELIHQNDDIRVILVGDDDQNIFEFRGSEAGFMHAFTTMPEAKIYQLTENHRSGAAIVSFANRWVSLISRRLKTIQGVSAGNEPASVEITEYKTPNLIVPASIAIQQGALSGSTGVLVRTNEEAIQLMALLRKGGINARLIQSMDKFPLKNLYELRFFSSLLHLDDKNPLISRRAWEEAEKQFALTLKTSTKYDLSLAVIRQFARIHPDYKYQSDWNTFLIESKLEDFVNIETGVVYVSTIHKSKGKEFDNVFIVLNNFDPLKEENKRLLYVAITRAKTRLHIHCNGSYLSPLVAGETTYTIDHNNYPAPTQLAHLLTHRDVNLGYFKDVQYHIRNLHSGDALIVNDHGLNNSRGRQVVAYSKSFGLRLADWRGKNYQLVEAAINYMVYWTDPEDGKEYIIVLPEVILITTQSSSNAS